ncbi:MAG: hypothetical protein HY898_36810 [Deltaproteobacteria bacterium]|nr:hypothetical protein [Deltaproteobacteria bacterium]
MPTFVTLFAATEEELDRFFPGWPRPADEPMMVPAEDLFTGEAVLIKRWIVPPDAPAPSPALPPCDCDPILPVLPTDNDFEQRMEDAGPRSLRSVPHACLKNLFGDHLRLLANLILGSETDARPQRVTPEGRSVDCLPTEAVRALAGHSIDELPALAARWAAEQTAGFDADGDALWALRRIHALANLCNHGAQRSLCLWVDS